MRITEPMTFATDLLMGLLAIVLAVRLARAGRASHSKAVTAWAGLFACTAAASFLGGSHHGLAAVLLPSANRWLWQFTLWATGVGSACMLAAAAWAGTSGVTQRVLLAVTVLKLVVYLWWMSRHDAFLFVIVDYATALLATLVIAWLSPAAAMRAARPWLNAGAAVAVVAALIQALKLAPHPHFNHNDLFHVVQMGALCLLYKGGDRLEA